MSSGYGKIITVSSVKGGVGKTTMTLNLAGIYYLMKKKVLIIDLELYAGGIATCLNVHNRKDIYMLIDTLSNNKQVSLDDYVATYNSGIDILACPKDPRDVAKIETKYLERVFDIAKREYDIVLLDTTHLLDDVTLISMDYSDNTLFIITNDLVDLKNTKSLLTIFKEMKKSNYKIVLNNSRDTGKDYMSLFDIRSMIKNNIDFTISRNFYIKNIDKYVINGEILTLNKNIRRFNQSDIKNMEKIALSLIKEVEDSE